MAAEGLKPLPQVDEDVGEEEEGREEQLRSQAEKLEATAAEAFNARMAKRSSAESRWLQLSRSSGTASDRVAALTLLVQESAVANMAALDQLLKFVTKAAGSKDVVGKVKANGSGTAGVFYPGLSPLPLLMLSCDRPSPAPQAIDALRELFTRVLLPDRPLVLLTDRPLSSLPAHTKLGAQHLLYWHIEDAIKRRYSVFVGALDDRSRDNIDFVKDRALKAAYELLSSKPELEARLLSIVVNKLGDPSRKLASKAGYLLLCLLDQHPGMKQVVVGRLLPPPPPPIPFRPFPFCLPLLCWIVWTPQAILRHRHSCMAPSAAVHSPHCTPLRSPL